MQPKDVTRTFYEDIWSEHRLELIDEIVAEDAVLHVWGREFHGREHLWTTARDVWLPAFPDLRAEIALTVAEGEYASDYVTFTGTHSGAPFHGFEPSGNAFSFTQTTICRVVDGRITDIWEDFDWAGLRQQLSNENSRT